MNVHQILWNFVFVVQCCTLALPLLSSGKREQASSSSSLSSLSLSSSSSSSLPTLSSSSSSFLLASLRPSSSSSSSSSSLLSPSSSSSSSSSSSVSSSASYSPLLSSSQTDTDTSESASDLAASRKKRSSQRREVQPLDSASSLGIKQKDDTGSDVSDSADAPSSQTTPHRLRHNKKRHRSKKRLSSRKRRRSRKKCRKNGKSRQRHRKQRKCRRRRRSKKKGKRKQKKKRDRKRGKKSSSQAEGDNSVVDVVKEKIVVTVTERDPRPATEKPSETAASWYDRAKPLQQLQRNEPNPITTPRISLNELASNFDFRKPLTRAAENVKEERHGRSVEEEPAPVSLAARDVGERSDTAPKRAPRTSRTAFPTLKRLSSSKLIRDKRSDGVDSDSKTTAPPLLTFPRHRSKRDERRIRTRLLRRQKRDVWTRRAIESFQERVTLSPSSASEERQRARRHRAVRDRFSSSRSSPRQRSFALDVQVELDFRRRS